MPSKNAEYMKLYRLKKRNEYFSKELNTKIKILQNLKTEINLKMAEINQDWISIKKEKEELQLKRQELEELEKKISFNQSKLTISLQEHNSKQQDPLYQLYEMKKKYRKESEKDE